MLNKPMAACLVATAFAVAPAMAQNAPPPPSGATDRPLATGSGSPAKGSPAMQPNAAGGPSVSSCSQLDVPFGAEEQAARHAGIGLCKMSFGLCHHLHRNHKIAVRHPRKVCELEAGKGLIPTSSHLRELR